MVVQHNLTAMNANRYLGINNNKLSKSLEKLSSGYAINRAGDNAAGLAVSEKMRSQIAGMTQGVKNAQDGISMVQTFEGALTETHSILQRMKTLADQMGNGTYDDPVDRTAAQQEFLQLNDELDQIADTDFNGVVVLNGGVMADGTVAKDGKFDYSLGYTKEVVAEDATDISGDEAHKIVTQNNYTKEIADAVWDAVGADVEKNQELNVTFMYDGNKWVAQTITDKDKNVIEGASASGLTAREVERDSATGRGGFEVIAGKYPETGKDIIATNAIFDEMKGPVKWGDTVTIKFENSKEKTYAPENAGIDECYKDNKPFDIPTDATVTMDDLKGKVSFKLDSGLTDDVMTKDLADALEVLDGADFTATYAAGTATLTMSTDNVTAANGFSADAVAIKTKVTLEGNDVVFDKNGANIKLGTVESKDITIDQKAADAKAEVTTALTGFTDHADFAINETTLKTKLGADATKANGAAVDTEFTYNGTAGSWQVGGADVDLADYGITGPGAAAFTPSNGNKFKVTYTPEKTAGEQTDKTKTGAIKFGVNVDAYNFASMTDLSVHAIATPEVATMKHQVAQDKVSVSNAFKNSEAKMTYKDSVILQVGARTKDAVNFTFKYNSNAIGDLEADLNCTAKGLGTDRLSIATQKDANYAVDKIDQAINKVSLVRGTFGAIQNRLEHKIDNMNVSIENLTSAESAIRDTNMPQEMMNFTKNQILAQASQSMLAQANQLPQGVLSLLQ